jgi:chromosome segregation ATPase
MDPTVQGALVTAGGLLLGALAGHVTGRRARNAGVELTEAQTADLETQVYERVIRTQETERQKLAARITELESQVAQLKAQAAAREQELQRDLESTRGELSTARAELASVRTQLAATQVELAAARKEAADLHLLIQVSSGQPAA